MQQTQTRKPAFAGQFYPASGVELKKQIESFLEKPEHKINALGCMLPHAGYMYSGKVAAQTLARTTIKDKIILLGPNHTGYGAEFSIMTQGYWQTPLGEVKIDTSLAEQIMRECAYLEVDAVAHLYEHSIEVELPLLQFFRTDFAIVPIAFMSDNMEALKKIGEGIGRAIKTAQCENSVMLIASSDMTHYEPSYIAQEKDKCAIEAIIELDENKLLHAIKEFNISMCGYAPVIVMLSCLKTLGARAAELIRYQTSGDTTGDQNSVVGYAGILIS